MAKDIEFNIIARDMASPVMEKVIQTSAKMQEALSEAGSKASESFKDVFKGKKAPPDKGSKENVKTKKKASVRKEDEGIVGGFTPIPKWMATPLRAIGAYRMAWLSGKKVGGREEETGERSKSGMAMGAAAGIYILQAMKDGIMKVVDILSQASPFLRAQLKILNIGFMQILKPFGDVVGTALKPIAKMMMQFARNSRQALRAAGLTPKDEEYLGTYFDMFTHEIWHMMSGQSTQTYNDLYKRAMEGAEKKEERLSLTESIGEYLKYLGYNVSDEVAKAFTEYYGATDLTGNAVLGAVGDANEKIIHDFFTSIGITKYGEGGEHPAWSGAMEALRERADELAGESAEDKTQWSDWKDLTSAERDHLVSETLLTDSNNGLISTNQSLLGAIIGLTQAMIQRATNYSMGPATSSRNIVDLEKLSYSPVEGMYAQGMGKTAYTNRPPYYGRG